jgi:hypothetical protein
VNKVKTVDAPELGSDFLLKSWLEYSRIDVNRYADGSVVWVAVAYDEKGGVIEYAEGGSYRTSIEALCADVGITTFWEINSEQP